MGVITIRDVPDDVKRDLAEQADAEGKSLQSYLLGLLTEEAGFSQNRRLMVEVEQWFADHPDDARGDIPPAAEVLREERRKAGRE